MFALFRSATKQTGKPVRIIVGLGNPGSKYARTRHNVGFRVIDALVADTDSKAKLKKSKYFEGVQSLVGGRDVFFAKPAVFMNLSGIALRALVQNFRIGPESCLVVVDDIYLPVGKIRFRKDGSSGGHNGLQSIIDELGTSNFPRLRVGIGQSEEEKVDLADYVLSAFSSEEEKGINTAVDCARQACLTWIEEGGDAVMHRYNGTA